MRLEGALRGVSDADILFAPYIAFVALLSAVIGFDFAAAWFAPRCTSVAEVGFLSWCLPIGFEGPFGDIWSNRSLANARISATFSLTIVMVAMACGVYFALKNHQRFRLISYLCGLAGLMILLIKGLVLNDFS
jgi:hypothetical protein